MSCLTVSFPFVLLLAVAAGAMDAMPDDLGATVVEHNIDYHRSVMSRLKSVLQTVNSLEPTLYELQSKQTTLAHAVNQRAAIIDQVNALQLQQLAHQLQTVQQRALEQRPRQRQEVSSTGDDLETVLDISQDELEQLFRPETIFLDSEVQLDQWIRNLLEEETEHLLEPLSSDDNDSHQHSDDTSKCVTPEVAAQHVQDVLVQHATDEIGLVDHARQGTIVHELTSPTYTPTTSSNTLTKWSKYLPQDWEEWLLPKSWYEQDIAVPASVSHTLADVIPIVGNQGTIAPPKTILQGLTHPGACWPMQGSSGQVTIQLPYPVSVSAVSVDHASSLLLKDATSAPKRMRIYGYAPCLSNQDCEGLSFDPRQKTLLRTLQYEITQFKVQTFDIGKDETTGLAAESEGDDLCAEDTGSCSAPPPDDVNVFAAMTIQILDNWGRTDYTCLYRIRVHGEPITI